MLATDTNADGNPLTAQLVAGPSNGQLTLNLDGSFSYTPNAGFWGTDSFTYCATDGTYTSVPATVTITVYSTPTANNDAFAVLSGQTLNTSVSSDIADVDGNSLTTVLLTGTANGQLYFDSSGDVSYVPNAGFLGTDSFSYYATDGYGAISAPATVTITVANIVAYNASYSTPEGQTLTINATALAPLWFDTFTPNEVAANAAIAHVPALCEFLVG